MRSTLIVIAIFAAFFAVASDASARGPLRTILFGPRARCVGSACGYSYSSTIVQKASPVQADEPTQKADAAQKGAPEQKAAATQKSAAQATAEYKVRYRATYRIRGHFGRPWGAGFSAEGVGTGTTPAIALGNCCTFRRPLVATAVAQDASGLWYGIKLFR